MQDFVISNSIIESSLFNDELIKRFRTIPLKIENGILHVGISNPGNHDVLSAISFHTGYKTCPVYIHENDLNSYIDKYYQNTQTPKIAQEKNEVYDKDLISLVNKILDMAISQLVSDIHIEPYLKHYRIRFRCDGVLYEKMILNGDDAIRFIARLKVMAKLDITEHRFPQDGRFQYHSIDIRMNACPTYFGEKIVLRLLNINKQQIDIHSIGLTLEQKKLFIEKLSQPYGMIIIAGPTSSGKTLTLYSALDYLNQASKNITSIEDPVEIQLAGINQLSTQSNIHLDFSNLLRAVLRQDPDIIMIGEIRDKETAEIAIQAATTGHLVLASLHCNNATESIPRLLSLGISPIHITSSISLIVAQRLIRKLCPYCKKISNNKTSYCATGCQHCLNGYKGRTGIFELLTMNQNLVSHILSGNYRSLIKHKTLEDGHVLLHQAANTKVLEGVTSSDEILRILAS